MESKITISFDYALKTPLIKIQFKNSDDERDKMVKAFLESMGGDICFAKFQYEISYDDTVSVAGIRPIPFVNLKDEVQTMQVWLDHVHKNVLGEPQYNYIHNNSIAFRDWLKSESVDFVMADHYTGIPKDKDLFEIGVKWEKYRELNEPK